MIIKFAKETQKGYTTEELHNIVYETKSTSFGLEMLRMSLCICATVTLRQLSEQGFQLHSSQWLKGWKTADDREKRDAFLWVFISSLLRFV